MMHLCRELFPTILEKEGRLLEILDANFGLPKYLYDDIMEKNAVSSFKNFIYFQYDNNYEFKVSSKSPFELMDEAGYTLYECKTNDEIMKFKKYYAEGEKLCTFKQNRLDYCHVFFAVKKNIDEIKRKDFKTPEREDEYGTSVISIQFSKGDVNTLSIKNRYNHTVHNPDATFHNNLENIIFGLTDSFERFYHLNINQEGQVNLGLDYVKANDGKLYKYNLEINDIYYCPDNIIIDHRKVIKDYIDKEKYILMDYFILNLQNSNNDKIPSKCFSLYDYTLDDCFIDDLQNYDKLEIKKLDKDNKRLIVSFVNADNVYIDIDKYHNIISYNNPNVKNLRYNFMYKNKHLKEIHLDNVQVIGSHCLESNSDLSHICLPNVTKIMCDFLKKNKKLKTLQMEKVRIIHDRFLHLNHALEYISIPNVIEIGDQFLSENEKLSSIHLPDVIQIGDIFLGLNNKISYLSMPKLKTVGHSFLRSNDNIINAYFPSLTLMSTLFLYAAQSLKYIDVHNVEQICDYCLQNADISELDIPNVLRIGNNFLSNNKSLKQINCSKVKQIGDNFLYMNEQLNCLSMPFVRKIGAYFIDNNTIINAIYMPLVEQIGSSFMSSNENLSSLFLPRIKSIGHDFLMSNQILNYLYAPNLKKVGESFLRENVGLEQIYLPSLQKVEYYFLRSNFKLKKLFIPKIEKYSDDFMEKLDFMSLTNKDFQYKLS